MNIFYYGYYKPASFKSHEQGGTQAFVDLGIPRNILHLEKRISGQLNAHLTDTDIKYLNEWPFERSNAMLRDTIIGIFGDKIWQEE